MLAYLYIKNLAIIDSTELELRDGLTALTGETGAGKSILLDALGLVIGKRASADVVKAGAERAEIAAGFAIDTLPEVQRWLLNEQLDEDGECLLRRTVSVKGKSRATVNGRPVSLQTLATLGEQLVRIHGQHAHQVLARPDEQRQLLDNFLNSALVGEVKNAFRRWQHDRQTLDTYRSEQRDRQQRHDVLAFQVQEFDALDTGGASAGDIESEHRWRANVERLLALGSEVLFAIDEDHAASAQLAAATRPLEALVSIDERLREALDLIESASIQTAEAASLLRQHQAGLEHDDSRLAWLDDRLGKLTRLSRKHGVDMSELPAIEQALRDELDALTAPAENDAALEEALVRSEKRWQALARGLSNARQDAAARLSAAVTVSMQTLGMEGGSFSIECASGTGAPTIHGADRITFLVQPNPDLPAAPLSRIASGGELSRISLCLQLATLDSQSVPTLLFDEVDVGIGGRVAGTVGALLRRVGERAQVLCITHLPQVAVHAHQHVRVSKVVAEGRTSTRLETLTGTATRDEIARMLGSGGATRKSRQHAQELLDAVH